jgi:hypothetical protein
VGVRVDVLDLSLLDGAKYNPMSTGTSTDSSAGANLRATDCVSEFYYSDIGGNTQGGVLAQMLPDSDPSNTHESYDTDHGCGKMFKAGGRTWVRFFRLFVFCFDLTCSRFLPSRVLPFS